MTKFGKITAVLALAAIGLTGCVPPQPNGSATQTTPTTATEEGAAADLQKYYSQTIDWQNCDVAGMLCALVTAPLDWEDPSKGDITLSMIKRPADGTKIGSLFTNPGGPGASGVGFVRDSSKYVFSKALLDSYDLIGWDPRGIGESTPVNCFADDAATDNFLFLTEYPDYEVGSKEYLDFNYAQIRELGAECERLSGDILGYVDSNSTAKDLDMMRALVGDDKLNYLGFSYGAFLGALYSELFADRVGRVVVDGPVDPSASMTDVTYYQSLGFEQGFSQYLEDCLSNAKTCPFRGDLAAAKQQTIKLIADLNESALTNTVDERKLDGNAMQMAIIAGLYTEKMWQHVSQAIAGVMDGDTTTAWALVDYYYNRDQNGHYADNSYSANLAINCLDYPVVGGLEQWHTDYERLAADAPIFGAQGGYSELFCDAWPVKGKHPRGKITAEGSNPIIVVGTTHDTATPYQWAVDLAASMQNGILLTHNGQGHTAYSRGNSCVDDTVDDFLLTGAVPENGKSC